MMAGAKFSIRDNANAIITHSNGSRIEGCAYFRDYVRACREVERVIVRLKLWIAVATKKAGQRNGIGEGRERWIGSGFGAKATRVIDQTKYEYEAGVGLLKASRDRNFCNLAAFCPGARLV
jgi:hypothetical protein